MLTTYILWNRLLAFFSQLWSEILTFSIQIWLESAVNSQTGCEFITQYWEHLGLFILLK